MTIKPTMYIPKDGTYDVRTSRTREVWVNGILTISISETLFNSLRDQHGCPVTLHPFCTYPDKVLRAA